MSKKPKKISKKQQEAINKKLGPVYAKVGGITFFIGLIALLIGLFIDRMNDTTPIFTLVLMVISVPLVLLLNSRMLRKEIAKVISEQKNTSNGDTKSE